AIRTRQALLHHATRGFSQRPQKGAALGCGRPGNQTAASAACRPTAAHEPMRSARLDNRGDKTGRAGSRAARSSGACAATEPPSLAGEATLTGRGETSERLWYVRAATRPSIRHRVAAPAPDALDCSDGCFSVAIGPRADE